MRKGLQQDVIKKLEDIVGENHVLKTDGRTWRGSYGKELYVDPDGRDRNSADEARQAGFRSQRPAQPAEDISR